MTLPQNKLNLVFLFLVTLIVNTQTVFSQSKPITEFSLDGTWDIIFDDANEAISENWVMNENFEKHPEKEAIKVPSCWEQTKKNYEGVAIYRTSFNIPKDWEDKVVEVHG